MRQLILWGPCFLWIRWCRLNPYFLFVQFGRFGLLGLLGPCFLYCPLNPCCRCFPYFRFDRFGLFGRFVQLGRFVRLDRLHLFDRFVQFGLWCQLNPCLHKHLLNLWNQLNR